MSDTYRTRVEVRGTGIGDVSVYLERVTGVTCPQLLWEWRNRRPLLPTYECIEMDLYSHQSAYVDVADGYEGIDRWVRPVCTFILKAAIAPPAGMIAALDFTTDNSLEIITETDISWGTNSDTGGQWSTGYRYDGTTQGTVPFSGRTAGDTATGKTTVAGFVSNTNNDSGGLMEITGDAEGSAGFIVSRGIGGALEYYGNGSTQFSGGTWTNKDWVSVIITHDPTVNEAKAYLDNVLIGTYSNASIASQINLLKIRGSITALYVYDYIFSSAERSTFHSLTGPIPL